MLIERAERTLDAFANGGIRLHPQSLTALTGRASRSSGRLLPWALCLLLSGLLLGISAALSGTIGPAGWLGPGPPPGNSQSAHGAISG